jgi:hypothetical protein
LPGFYPEWYKGKDFCKVAMLLPPLARFYVAQRDTPVLLTTTNWSTIRLVNNKKASAVRTRRSLSNSYQFHTKQQNVKNQQFSKWHQIGKW